MSKEVIHYKAFYPEYSVRFSLVKYNFAYSSPFPFIIPSGRTCHGDLVVFPTPIPTPSKIEEIVVNHIPYVTEIAITLYHHFVH